MAASTPKSLKPGHWHLPFISEEEWDYLGEAIGTGGDLSDQDTFIKLSVARCARVSYMNHDDTTPDMAADLALYDRLVGSQPLHASPAEHQATPDEQVPREYVISHDTKHSSLVASIEKVWTRPHLHGNFRGWVQYRKTLPGECQ